MINIETLIGDSYSRNARLKPALLTMLPMLISIIMLVSKVATIWTVLLTILVSCGVARLLMQLARDRGKKLEPLLFEKWGGKPSVAMLRYCDERLPKLTKERYRTFLEKTVPNLKLASKQMERKNPSEADVSYESATNWLLAKTRDHERFNLLFEENMNYGFRRNIWALKPHALAIDIINLLFLLGYVLFYWQGSFISTIQTIGIPILATGLLVTVIHSILFLYVFRPEWVRIPAEEYAKHLLAACDELEVS